MDLWIDSKSLSWTIKSELSLATSQPDPIQKPTSAANRASASAMPSPVMPTIPDLPCFGSSEPSCEYLLYFFSSFLLTYLDLMPEMRMSLSSEVARASTFNFAFTFLNESISLNSTVLNYVSLSTTILCDPIFSRNWAAVNTASAWWPSLRRPASRATRLAVSTWSPEIILIFTLFFFSSFSLSSGLALLPLAYAP